MTMRFRSPREIESGDERADALRDRCRDGDVVGNRVHAAPRTPLAPPRFARPSTPTRRRSRPTRRATPLPLRERDSRARLASTSSRRSRARRSGTRPERTGSAVVRLLVQKASPSGSLCRAHRPRYALRSSSCSRSSAALPSSTTRPVDSTYPRSAIESETFAFCSTTSTATPGLVHLLDDLEAALDEYRSKTHGRLVHEQQLGSRHQRAGHCHHLLLSAGEGAGELGAALVEQRKKTVDAVVVLALVRLPRR